MASPRSAWASSAGTAQTYIDRYFAGVKLDVPLVVEVGVGDDWDKAY